MRTFVPEYYQQFHCIADRCRHTCCQGWEVDIDAESLLRFEEMSDVREKIVRLKDENDETQAFFALLPDERCPFLQDDGLCRMIVDHGEDVLCQICRDHPRFRNYFTGRIELGLGLVCEEAGRIILGSKNPMKLVEVETEKAETEGKTTESSGAVGAAAEMTAEDDESVEAAAEMTAEEDESVENAAEVTAEEDELPEAAAEMADEEDESVEAGELPDDEAWLLQVREELLLDALNDENGEPETYLPMVRFREYLIFRHIPDALYDDRLEERIAFVDRACSYVRQKFSETDGSFEAFVECCRQFSYDIEYDEEVKETWIEMDS